MTQSQNNDTPSPERLERAKKFEAQFQPRDLTGASLQEVGQAAIDYTLAQFSVLSGTPKVVLAQPVTSAELSSLGLADINFVNREPPMALVIVKGNFDVSNLPGRVPPGVKRQNKVKYIAYAFDLRAGIPTLTTTALYGEIRQALKDDSLPDIPKLAGPDGYKPPSEMPAIANPRRSPKLPYGSVLPPVEGPPTEDQ